MKIVVLDGYAANPGDISWDEMKTIGELTVYDRTSPDEIVDRCRGAEAVLTNKCPLKRETLQSLKELKYIGVLATGYNIVDTAAAREMGIAVTNVPAYSTECVAQLVMAFILEAASHVGAHSAAALGGQWQNCKDFVFWNYPLVELCGKRLGVIGHGAIGKRVAQIGRAFGMQVNTYSPSQNDAETLEDIITGSDIISLNCPLKKENEKMINADTIGRMKQGVWIINTARGGLVDEAAAAEGLRQGKIGYFCADVVSKEPIEGTNPLLHAPNVMLTPHIGWAPFEARVRLMNISCENLRAFCRGEKKNRVEL